MSQTLSGLGLGTRQASTNRMTFLFSDGASPVAEAELKVVALGRSSAPGKKSDLDNDMELSARLETDADGQFAVDDASLSQGFDLVSKIIRRKRPNARAWEGVPGLPMPGSGYHIHPSMKTDPSYPVVPIVVQLIDPSFTPSPVVHELEPVRVVTPWQRPPIGEIDVQQFSDTCAYLKSLADRYLSLANVRPPHLALANTRIGTASPLESVFGQLGVRLNPPGLRNSQAVKAMAGLLQKTPASVYKELQREMSLPAGRDLVAGYLAALRGVASLACTELGRGPGGSHAGLLRLTRALGRGVGVDLDRAALRSPYEDYACLGTAVFLVAAIVRGYQHGTITWAWDWSSWRLDAVVSTSTTCGQDEFYRHCELMRP